MTRRYRILGTVQYLITVDGHNEEDAVERAVQIPFSEWDDMINIDHEIISVDPEDDYEDASRDD